MRSSLVDRWDFLARIPEINIYLDQQFEGFRDFQCELIQKIRLNLIKETIITNHIYLSDYCDESNTKTNIIFITSNKSKAEVYLNKIKQLKEEYKIAFDLGRTHYKNFEKLIKENNPIYSVQGSKPYTSEIKYWVDSRREYVKSNFLNTLTDHEKQTFNIFEKLSFREGDSIDLDQENVFDYNYSYELIEIINKKPSFEV